MSKTKKEIHKNLEVQSFKSVTEWIRWLKRNHSTVESGLWIKLAKKNSGIKSVTYEESRDAAIRFGWIDGLINKYDESFYLTRFTPRRPRSNWSKVNKKIAIQLIADGLMTEAGMAQVEAAKADGRWDAAYDSQSTIKVPPDLRKRLSEEPKAKKFFDSISKANRYSFLYRIQTAKREATRLKRIETTIEMLNKGETYH